jgi:hypothetical protein
MKNMDYIPRLIKHYTSTSNQRSLPAVIECNRDANTRIAIEKINTIYHHATLTAHVASIPWPFLSFGSLLSGPEIGVYHH